MLNEFDAFAHDFIPRIRREVVAEMEAALKNLSRR